MSSATVLSYKRSQSHPRSIFGDGLNIIKTISHCIWTQFTNRLTTGKVIFLLSDDISQEPADPPFGKIAFLSHRTLCVRVHVVEDQEYNIPRSPVLQPQLLLKDEVHLEGADAP